VGPGTTKGSIATAGIRVIQQRKGARARNRSEFAGMVSVFEGQLTRTWVYPPYTETDEISSSPDRGEVSPTSKKSFLVNLYHDTITGVRSVMINYEEVPGSLGNSSLLMESSGHRIPFVVAGKPGA
jgi:hypothetical protein